MQPSILAKASTVAFDGSIDDPFELVTPARDLVEIIVGEIAPFLFDLSFELLPISFNTIPIHSSRSFVRNSAERP